MKKEMLKKVVSLAVAAALSICLFAGCGTEANDKDEQGRTIITVGGWPDKEGKSLDTYTARKERFEESNPDVVVEPDFWAFDRKTFYAKAAGGQLPISYNAGFTEAAEIINSEYSAELTDVLKKHGYDGMFNEAVLDIVTDDDGKIFAFPVNSYILGLGFNTELFKAAGLMEEDGTPKQPKNWDEVLEFAIKIKEITGKPGIVFPTANRNGGWIFTSFAWSFGVDFMEKGEDGKWKATFNTPEAAEALQWIKDLKWKYDVLPANTLIDGTEYYKTFGVGGAGMLIAAGDYPAKIAQYGMTPDQVGIMAMPAGPKRHVTLLGGDIHCVSPVATDDQIDAAIRWVETGYSYEATEDFKATAKDALESQLSKGQLVGVKSMSPWSSKSEALTYKNNLIDEMANSNPNHVRLYNEFVENCPAEIQPEEPVCCQELYATLDGCIQEVLINENADCAALLEKANADFQANYLDNLTY